MYSLFIIFSFLFFLVSVWFLSKIHRIIGFTDNIGKNKEHSQPRATGSGLILIILIFIYLYLFVDPIYNYNTDKIYTITRFWFLKFSLLSLLIVSLLDFKFEIEPRVRLCLQLSICYISLSCLPLITSSNIYIEYLNFLPLKIIEIFIIFLWVYIINITNFIDGIDGSVGIKLLTTFSGYFLLNIFNDNVEIINLICLFVIVHSLLVFTSPIIFKTFLSDMGSIPLGFLSGWMFMFFLIHGFIFEVLLINLIYFLDIIYTHLKKIFVSKESIFVRHRDFVYQKYYKSFKNKWKYLFFYFIINTFPVIILYLYLI